MLLQKSVETAERERWTFPTRANGTCQAAELNLLFWPVLRSFDWKKVCGNQFFDFLTLMLDGNPSMHDLGVFIIEICIHVYLFNWYLGGFKIDHDFYFFNEKRRVLQSLDSESGLQNFHWEGLFFFFLTFWVGGGIIGSPPLILYWFWKLRK